MCAEGGWRNEGESEGVGGGGDRRSALSRGEKLGVGIHHANNDHTAGAETAIVTGQSEEERHRTPRTHTHARTHARTQPPT